jgi:nitric oxide reductase subunit B
MKRLWYLLAFVMVASFAVLGWIGTRIYQEMPPIPRRVVTTEGRVIVPEGGIGRGQNVWQAMGGMELGSIWGHGSYVAPDWTADWLHREAVYMLDRWAQAEFGGPFEGLSAERKAMLQGRLQATLKANRYDAATGDLTIEPLRAQAFASNADHYAKVFRDGEAAYAIPPGTVSDPARLADLSAFIFWTSWSAVTNRVNSDITYTHNWPYEPLVGNTPTGESVVWTGVSVIVLLAGIAGMVWWYAARDREEGPAEYPAEDPLRSWAATPSQKATLKYFWIVTALMLVQMLLGVVVAHYGVEGTGFYGIPLAKWLPYSVGRTWHVQMGLFWIATSWLAAGLFIGPLVGEHEPRFQRLGVNVLFLALLVVVFGSLAGQWLSVFHHLDDRQAFLFGHQGYEYVDLGRVWQIGLFVGLLLWLALVVRSAWPAFRRPGAQRHLLGLFLLASAAIGLFYAAGLAWGQHTHLSMVEYWRWWVVHLWVEGFFEVFATAVIAFLFARLGLVKPGLAASAAVLSAAVFLSGGIIGTCHHLYFSGTPTVALAFGSVFSALEVVPLVLVAYGALDDLRLTRARHWVRAYRWPIYFFVSVAFWNMLGAGLFGFMINPPIALYYMQGLNTTPVHGHSALFGVYGMLGLGLMLMCLRALVPARPWKETLLRVGFWSLNVGLFLQVVVSLLPVGLMQTWAAVEHGYWYARSAEFMGTHTMQTLRWLRVPGDTLFALGAVAIALFVAGLKLGYSYNDQGGGTPSPLDVPAREPGAEPAVRA